MARPYLLPGLVVVALRWPPLLFREVEPPLPLRAPSSFPAAAAAAAVAELEAKAPR
jgi:hypothetical protein